MAVRVHKEDSITTVVLSRQEVRNAVDRETAAALADAFRDFDQDPQARVGILYGDHSTFCAGADLKAIAQGNANRLEPDGDGPMGPSRMLLSKPVIAAIAGYAVAGGLELALWCDLRIMEANACVGVFCRRWGVPLIDGGPIRLPRLIGLARALDLILTGRAVAAEEAQQMGLANRVVPAGTALQAAQELARELAQFPQTCLRNDRLSAYEQFDLTWEDAIRNEFERGTISLQESAAGVARFAAGEGRHGAFKR